MMEIYNLLIYIDKIYIFGLTPSIVMYIIIMTLMDKNIPSDSDSKKAALRAAGALHPNPNAIRDEAFLQGDFFDPNDLVQVKYEMLRRHREEQKTVAEVARAFSTSRQAFYSAKALFDSHGIPGLLPKRRGPRGAHKCTDEVLDFAEQWKDEHPAEGTIRLAEVIEQRFGIHIHPRSIDRALVRRKKKRHPGTETPE
jgi:transposase